jgi:ligand-binding SRPBCC domain-containing protein
MTTFDFEFWLAASPDRVFAFFADAMNLRAITPEWLDFRVVTPAPIEMGQGAVIEHRMRFLGLAIGWQSEITAWEPMVRFVDEQRRGPCKVWIHEHRFEERDGGTLVMDHVTCATAGGRIVERLLVGPCVRRVFAYREQRLRQIFGGSPAVGTGGRS